jgi:predicted dehydrogenase
MKLGLLSTARINEQLVAGARQARGVEVVAIGSRDRARGEAQAHALGIPRVHDSYEALLADSEVEAVYVALPNSLHVDWSLRALGAGRHVLCEKPLSRRAEDVERAFDAADRGGLVLAEAFMWRHHPQARRLVELREEIGELRLIRASFSFLLERAGDVRLRTALDGGALMDVGCYCVNGARMIAGEPERVGAEQVLGGDGVDVAFAATMRFADGVIGQFDAGLALDTRDELEAVGEEGALFLADPWHCRHPVIELRRDGKVERIELEPVDSYRLEAENFCAAIRGTASPLLGREDAVSQARAIEALYQAAELGQTVTLS